MNTIIVGCGFGDEGKGVAVDCHTAKSMSKPLIVRFSGGPQAGHTVFVNGINHVSSNFGSGVLRNAPTFFSKHTCINPLNIFNEYEALRAKGFDPLLAVDPLATVITPEDVYKSQYNKGGTCGMGIGAAMHRQLATPYKLHAIDLMNKEVWDNKMESLFAIGSPYDTVYMEAYKRAVEFCRVFLRVETFESISQNYPNIIFEGSQGTLLDMDHGVFPEVTYANTTVKNALEMIPKDEAVQVVFTSRTYTTRHGNGWMPDTEKLIINNPLETNVYNEFQGKFRTAKLSLGLVKHSINVNRAYYGSRGNIQEQIIWSCCDQVDPPTPIEDMINLYNCSPESKTIYV